MLPFGSLFLYMNESEPELSAILVIKFTPKAISKQERRHDYVECTFA